MDTGEGVVEGFGIAEDGGVEAAEVRCEETRCFGFAAVGGLAATVERCGGAALAEGEASTGWADPTSGVLGESANQKSRSVQSFNAQSQQQ